MPLKILFGHLAIISLLSFLLGSFTIAGFIIYFGGLSVLAIVLDVLLILGFAFFADTYKKGYIEGLGLSIGILLVMAFIALSQVQFSR